MTVLCPGCRRAMRVPPDKENVPNLRARCSACGRVFAVAEASLALVLAAGAAPPPAPEPEPTLAPEIAALLADTEGEQAATEEGQEETGESGVEAEEGFVDEPAVPAWAYVAFALALLWKLVYSPVALVAGAISQSFLKTLNPVVGLDAIRKMGPTYWAAMGLYTVLAVGEFLAGAALGLVPFVGAFLRAFVQSYAYLAIGCLLGLAVFKKAPELGLD